MDICVCVKRVPLTQEVDLEIDEYGKDVKKKSLAYAMNEWDNYAIEEAITLKEKLGGMVLVVTVGHEEDEEVLRRCLAMGADKAVRVDPGGRPVDGFVLGKILSEIIRKQRYDLVLMGVQSDDDNLGMMGPLVAEEVGLAHAAVVNGVSLDNGEATIQVELEGGTNEVSRIQLPALLSIQTGINEPRYVSIMGIRKAAKKELEVIPVEALNLSEDSLSPKTFVEEVFYPPETEGAEIIEGDPKSVAEEITRIMKEKGVSV